MHSDHFRGDEISLVQLLNLEHVRGNIKDIFVKQRSIMEINA